MKPSNLVPVLLLVLLLGVSVQPAHARQFTLWGKPLNAFSVRKKPKDHGNIKAHRVEGDISPGQNVIIVEDVITTGGSTLQAMEAAREFGLTIVRVVALLDREEGGRENIEKLNAPVHTLFTLSQFTSSL